MHSRLNGLSSADSRLTRSLRVNWRTFCVVDPPRAGLSPQAVAYLRGVHAARSSGRLDWRGLGLMTADTLPVMLPDGEAGLLRELDAAVLKDACLQLGRWSGARDGLLPRLSVNISATSLADPLLFMRIRDVLASSGFPGDQLFLEITETTLVEDVASAFTNIAEIKSLGIRLAVDDFGTGYSSLRYLRRFPVGILKIDRSFVDGLGHDLEDEVIVETVIRMACSLGIEVVAEGVETLKQEQILRRLGCHYLQGFLYGSPADAVISSELYASSVSGMLGVSLQVT